MANVPSSKRLWIVPHSFPIFFSYASKTEAKRGSASGWVDAKARSRTYRSTALSSTKFELYARPKSISTLNSHFGQIVLELEVCRRRNHTSDVFSVFWADGCRRIIFDVVRSPCMISAICIFAISVPIRAIRVPG